MINYKNGKVYKILDSDNKCVYIGSTALDLRTRWNNHKYNRDNWSVHVVEHYSCSSRKELEAREEEYRKKLKPSLNKRRCSNGIPYRYDEKGYHTCKRFRELYYPKRKCECGRMIVARNIDKHYLTKVHKRKYLSIILARSIYSWRHNLKGDMQIARRSEGGQDPPVVVHKIPMTWTVYLTIYVQILGKSFGKFIWDFIGNLALIYINVWSNGLILKCQSHRKITPQWWTPVVLSGLKSKNVQRYPPPYWGGVDNKGGG